MKPAQRFTVGAIIAAALVFDGVAVLAVTPIATGASRHVPLAALWKAGRVALVSTGDVARKGLARVAGDGLVAAAREATRLYATMLRMSSPGHHVRLRCRVVTCTTGGAPAIGIVLIRSADPPPAEALPPSPARLFSQTL